MAHKIDSWIILVIGDRKVGKTSFRFKVYMDYFVSGEDIDSDEVTRKMMVIDDKCAIVDFVEVEWIPEQTFFPGSTNNYLPGSPGFMKCCDHFILMYDITSADSFTSIEFHHRLVTELKTKKRFGRPREPNSPLFFLVGTKSDLEDKREVSTSAGQELAGRLEGCLGFMETSCTGDPSQVVHDYVQALRIACPPPPVHAPSSSPKQKNRSRSTKLFSLLTFRQK